FPAEDGIRDRNVTGVQTCALPIFIARRVAGQPYHEVDAGFGPGDANTQLVKVVYDEKTRAVLAAEAEVSAHPPDEATRRAIRARSEERRVGNGGGCRGGTCAYRAL